MLTKSDEKYVNSLRIKKYRETNGAFVAEGEKLAQELLLSAFTIQHIFARKEWIAQHSLAADQASKLVEVTEPQMEKLSELVTPSNVLVVAEIPDYDIDETELTTNMSLLLDGIQDPGNLGTIIRIADWFGIPYVFCSPNSVDAYNPKVVQATMGSISRVKVIERDLLLLTLQYPDIPSYAAVLNGKNLFEERFGQEGFIVIGNESKGVSASLQHACSNKISIPSFGKAESLNASVATGIICAQVRAGR